MIEALAAIGGVSSGVGLIAVLVMAFKLSSAQDEREAARILASSTAGELVRAKDAIERLTTDLKIEQERADALDDELATAYNVPDPVGARERVLARWKAEHDSSRGRAVKLPAPTPARAPGPVDLLDPSAEG